MTQSTMLPFASISRRFFASLIDGIILGIVEAIISFVYVRYYLSDKLLSLILLAKAKGGALPEEALNEIVWEPWIVTGVFVIVCWLYFAVMESRSGATIGKKMMNLQVTDDQGGPVSFGKASIRYFAKILSGIILCLGYVMALFSEKRQALHDVLARTVVLDGAQTFVSNYARPDISAMHFSGEVPSDGTEDYIDLNKDPLEHLTNNLNDPRLHAFGSVQLPTESTHTPPVQPVMHTPRKAEPVDNTFGEIPPEQTFIDPSVTPVKPASPVPVPKKSVAVPAPVPVSQASTPSLPTGAAAPKPQASPTGRACPACGAPVGQYQTKCMKCKADLQPGGVGKKLFGKF